MEILIWCKVCNEKTFHKNVTVETETEQVTKWLCTECDVQNHKQTIVKQKTQNNDKENNENRN